MSSRQFLVLVALVALLTSISGLSRAAEEIVRIGLATSTWAPYAPVYLADDLGYYAKHGIKVEVTAYRGGGAAQQALAADAADIINFTPPGVALAVKKGIKEKIIGPGMPTPLGWNIVVLADSPIQSLTDLEGKKVGISRKGSTTDFFSLAMADRAGVTVETVPVGTSALISALKAGDIDAATANSTVAGRLLFSGEGRSLADLGEELPPVLPDVWVASQAMLDSRPEIARAVLEAIYKATVHLQENRDFALGYLKDFTRLEDDELIERELDVVIAGRSVTGEMDPAWLEASLALAALIGLDELPPVSELYTDAFADVSGHN